MSVKKASHPQVKVSVTTEITKKTSLTLNEEHLARALREYAVENYWEFGVLKDPSRIEVRFYSNSYGDFSSVVISIEEHTHTAKEEEA